MQLSNTAYDIIKKIVQLGLPASATLYFTLAQIWNLPYAEAVVGTIAAITTFLGVILGISSSKYISDENNFAGTLVTEEEEGVTRYVMQLHTENPEDILEQKTVTFKVA